MNTYQYGYENTVGEVGLLSIRQGDMTVPLITIKDAAKLYNKSPSTIRRWLDEGKLIGINVGRFRFVQTISFENARQALDEIPF